MNEDTPPDIFEGPAEGFAERFPHLAACWKPFLRSLLDRDFDLDSLRKAVSDNHDFQQWLLDKNMVLFDIPPSLIDEFIRCLRARFRKRNHHPMDRRAVLDVRGAIESFLAFAAQDRNHPSRKLSGPGAGS